MVKDALVVLLNDAIEVYKSEVENLSDIRSKQIQSLRKLGDTVSTDVMLIYKVKRLINEIEHPGFFSQAFFISIFRPSRFVQTLKAAINAYHNALKAYKKVPNLDNTMAIPVIEIVETKKALPSVSDLKRETRRLALGY